MTYKHWINKNYDILVSEYEDYFDSIDKEDSAKAYDKYVIANNLEHTKNFN